MPLTRLACLIAALLVSACVTGGPQDLESGSDDARVNQLMRVADGAAAAGDNAAAADLFARAARIDPAAPGPLIGLGRSLRRLGRTRIRSMPTGPPSISRRKTAMRSTASVSARFAWARPAMRRRAWRKPPPPGRTIPQS